MSETGWTFEQALAHMKQGGTARRTPQWNSDIHVAIRNGELVVLGYRGRVNCQWRPTFAEDLLGRDWERVDRAEPCYECGSTQPDPSTICCDGWARHWTGKGFK
jgi:hypothetical protein